MTPTTIIREARAEGVKLVLSPGGTIKAIGDNAAVNRWLAVIREHKAEIIDVLKARAGETATIHRWWLVHYEARAPIQVACTPAATCQEVNSTHPGAIAAEPCSPTSREHSEPMTAREEAAIRSWLALIGEVDLTAIAEVICLCQQDDSARRYFMNRAAESPRENSQSKKEPA